MLCLQLLSRDPNFLADGCSLQDCKFLVDMFMSDVQRFMLPGRTWIIVQIQFLLVKQFQILWKRIIGSKKESVDLGSHFKIEICSN